MTANVQTDRAVQSFDSLRRQAELSQVVPALLAVDPRAECADIKGPGVERGQQRHVVQPRVVSQGDDGGAFVGLDVQHRLVRHARDESSVLRVPTVGKLGARIADQHLEIQ
ncbi:hypothetical protein D3C73_1261900 [compost metagenome]